MLPADCRPPKRFGFLSAGIPHMASGQGPPPHNKGSIAAAPQRKTFLAELRRVRAASSIRTGPSLPIFTASVLFAHVTSAHKSPTSPQPASRSSPKQVIIQTICWAGTLSQPRNTADYPRDKLLRPHSGPSMGAFCRRHRLAASTFLAWRAWGRRASPAAHAAASAEMFIGCLGVERWDRNVDDPQLAHRTVPAAGLDEDGGHGFDRKHLTIQLHVPLTLEDEIQFRKLSVVVRLAVGPDVHQME